MNNPFNSGKCGKCTLALAFQATASVLNQTLHLNEVLDRILESVGQVVPNDAANIMLIEEDYAKIVACHGYEKIGGIVPVMGQIRKIAEIPNLVSMVRTHQPIVVPNTNLSPDWITFKTSTWIHSYTSAPILHRDKIFGFINLNSAQAGYYTPEDAARLLAFADQAAVAIQNARLFEEAQREIAERKLAEEELQKAKAELEVRVEQRTLELLRTNDQLRCELERRQQAEAALEKERAGLERKIQERTAELSSANAELAKAAKMKDSFLASMSHELRTPLNAVLNISETLQEQVFGPLNPKQLHLAHTIEESGRHLMALINDILDLSKIGAGKLELVWDTIPVKILCDTTIKLIEESARKKNLIVSTNIDPSVKFIRGDQRRMKQVLLNLLNNAIKFTPSGGSISLIVWGDRNRQQVRFTISDSGIGISEEDIKLLFRPFTQLDNGLSRQYEGTGLGLALVYHLVQLHGGSIQVESKANIGSSFTVVLRWMDEPGWADMSNPKYSTNNAHVSNEEQNDPISRLCSYLNEIAIDVGTYWLDAPTPGFAQKVEPGIVIIDTDSTGEPGRIIEKLTSQGLYPGLPTLILSSAGEPMKNMPSSHQVCALNFPFSRQDLRSAIKKVTPLGTASLISRAVLVRNKEQNHQKIKATVLVVDDNETSARFLGEYLEMNGIKPIFAHNGIDAVARAKEGRPGLILMDIQMPKMDGLEAIRSIRNTPETHNIPIIALTALAMEGDRNRCLEAGADDYLSKPITLKMLLSVINERIK